MIHEKVIIELGKIFTIELFKQYDQILRKRQ